MSSVSKTNTFVAGTYAEAAEVNQNFDDIIDYVNDEVIVRDGSKAFTAVPSGPAVDPTSDDQFSRKKYVDDKVTTLTTTVTANKTAQDNGFKVRPTMSGADNQILKSASVVVTTDASGEATITFPAAFPSTLTNVVACCEDATAVFVTVLQTGKSKTGFKIRAYGENVVTVGGSSGIDRFRSASVRVSYIAIGT